MTETATGLVPIGISLPTILVIVGLAVTAALVALTVHLYRRDWDYDSMGADLVSGMAAAVTLVMTIIIALVTIFPFAPRYLSDYHIAGEVISVTNTLDGGSGDVTVGSYVVGVDGMDRPVEVGDPRIVQLVGEDILLRCNLGWQWRAVDKVTCQIASF